MPYSFTLTTTIPASPQEIYDAWLDSVAHSEMTGGEATMSEEIGAEVSAWDGYIIGRNLELIPGRRIVQSWRTTEFGDEHEDSIVTVTLEETPDGTLLTLAHENVPDAQRSYEEGGWQSNYFEPMQDYFAGRRPAKAPVTKRKRNQKARSTAQSKAPRKAKAKQKPGARATAKVRGAKSASGRAKPTKERTAKAKSRPRKRR